MLNINQFKKKYDEQKDICQKPKETKVVKTPKQKDKDDIITMEDIDNYHILEND